MNLTIVVITQPSRIRYLRELLDSLEAVLNQSPSFKAIIFANGTSTDLDVLLDGFLSKFLSQAHVLKRATNDPMPDSFFFELLQFDLEWVQFPGDDDILNPHTYLEAIEIASKHEHIAIASSAVCIDEHSQPTGRTIQPSAPLDKTKAQQVLSAFHLPPFVWPSLIFRIHELPTPIFSSRFVFDWWASAQLIIRGEIAKLSKPLIKYRIHPQQESNLVLEERKRWEASIMLESLLLLEGMALQKHLKELENDLDQHLQDCPPIYGDIRYGAPLAELIFSLVDVSMAVSKLRSNVQRQIATTNGIVMNEREFPTFRRSAASPRESRLNFSITGEQELCARMHDVLVPLVDLNSPLVLSFACAHTPQDRRAEAIFLDCSVDFGVMSQNVRISSILDAIQKHSRSVALNQSELSAIEIKIVETVRRLKIKLRNIRRYTIPQFLIKRRQG